MSEQRDFKGVWIPKAIYLDDRLTALEKIVLVEIDSLSGVDGCFCSNEYLARFCQCSERKISDSVSKLIEFGYIEVESFDGRKRILRSRLEKTARQDCRNCEADEDIHYINNNINNKNNISCASSQAPKHDTLVDEFFEKMWKQYPRKRGKSAVSKKAKSEIFKAGKETIELAIANYKEEIERLHTKEQYIMIGSSFFNTRWRDYVCPDSDNDADTFFVPKGRLASDDIENMEGTY